MPRIRLAAVLLPLSLLACGRHASEPLAPAPEPVPPRPDLVPPAIRVVFPDPTSHDVDGDGLVDIAIAWSDSGGLDPASVRIVADRDPSRGERGDLARRWRIDLATPGVLRIEEVRPFLLPRGPNRLTISVADRAGHVSRTTVDLVLPELAPHATARLNEPPGPVELAVWSGRPDRLFVLVESAVWEVDEESLAGLRRVLMGSPEIRAPSAFFVDEEFGFGWAGGSESEQAGMAYLASTTTSGISPDRDPGYGGVADIAQDPRTLDVFILRSGVRVEGPDAWGRIVYHGRTRGSRFRFATRASWSENLDRTRLFAGLAYSPLDDRLLVLTTPEADNGLLLVHPRVDGGTFPVSLDHGRPRERGGGTDIVEIAGVFAIASPSAPSGGEGGRIIFLDPPLAPPHDARLRTTFLDVRGARPVRLAPTPDDRELVVGTCCRFEGDAAGLLLYDFATRTRLREVVLPSGIVRSMVVDEDGALVYVALERDGRIELLSFLRR